MPRVKIAYVVSFSSEDPEHRAANLLAPEVSKKKWLCSKWEPSCSVVLQLEKAVEISAVNIGAYNTALIEVLVGLSERPHDPFQVLVPSCVFVSAAQSRKAEAAAAERVRSFPRADLAADTAGRRYDRVRVLCTQPYNKHCKYGLSFIHIYEPESLESKDAAPSPATSAPPAPAVPPRLFNFDMESSDEENFRPGELFAKHLKSPTTSDENATKTSTSAQIRQATSHALKNVSDTSSKLLKTPISASSTNRPKKNDNCSTDTDKCRQRDNLMYDEEDERPHDKIDRIVNRHNDEKNKKDDNSKTNKTDKHKDKEKFNVSTSEQTKNRKDDNNGNKVNKDVSVRGGSNTDKHRQKDPSTSDRTPKHGESQKRGRDGEKKVDNESEAVAGPVCAELSEVLRGVTLVLSGYEGAERAALRDTALALGAAYSPVWGPHCTHLVCAFPNTPKLRSVRAESREVGVATARWLRECRARRRRLPWRWFATLPAERLPEPPETPETPEPTPPAQTTRAERSPEIKMSIRNPEEDEDTDDEIERALSAKKKPRIESPMKPPLDTKESVTETAAVKDANVSSDSDVTFVRDERFLGHVTIDSEDDDDEDTDRDDTAATPTEERIDVSKALPDFFDGYTFVILPEVGEQYHSLLARYVRAYGGLVIEASEAEESEVHYVVGRGEGGGGGGGGGAGGGAERVSARWVWRCHRAARLLTADD